MEQGTKHADITGRAGSVMQSRRQIRLTRRRRPMPNDIERRRLNSQAHRETLLRITSAVAEDEHADERVYVTVSKVGLGYLVRAILFFRHRRSPARVRATCSSSRVSPATWFR
jgi:hypothetical protein